MGFSGVLKSALESLRQHYPALDLSKRGILLNNLIFCYHTMIASEQLLEFARDASEDDGELHEYFSTHLEEERGHAAWLKRDLQTACINVESLIVSRETVELVGSQYYLVLHVDPAALLGYMALLEGFSTPLESIERLEAMHGKELLRTVRYHAEHDESHSNDLFAVADKLPHGRQAIVYQSALQSATYFGRALQKITH